MTGIKRILLAGLTVSSVTVWTLAQQPAAKVGAVRAGTPEDADITSRSAPPDYDRYFDDSRPAGTSDPSKSASAPTGSMLGRAWNNMKNWGGEQVKSLDEPNTVDRKLMPLSPATIPQFHQGGRGTVPPTNQPQPNRFGGPQTQAGFRPQPAQPPAVNPANRFSGQPVMAGPGGTGQVPPMIAGKPAFNWYGWGSSVPGGNPHAPQGNYPQGSPNWMMQSGATPGAFPLTGMPQSAVIAGPNGVNPTQTLPTQSQAPVGPVSLPSPGTITPPPFSSPVVPAPVAPSTATPTLTVIPTIAPPPQPTTTNPVLFPSFPAQPVSQPVPANDEPAWAPAPRKPMIEQTTGSAGNETVIQAVAFEPEEPTWQTAKLPTPKLQPVPMEPMPAPKPTLPDLSGGGLPAPIPAVTAMSAALTPTPRQSQPVTIVQPRTQPQSVAPSQVTATEQQAAAQHAWKTATSPALPVPIATANPFPVPVHQSTPTATTTRTETQYARPTTPAQAATGRTPNRPAPTVMANSPTVAETPLEIAPPREIVITTPKHVMMLEQMIGQACIKSATVLDVTETAPQRLKVQLACKTELAARDAAQEIAKIAALKPYTVDFEVRLSTAK